MLVYLVRHGESEYNLSNQWTGWADVPLTDKGRADAGVVNKFLTGIRFDKVYSSDLVRAVETAQIALPGCALETDEIFREVNIGSLAGRSFVDFSDEERLITGNHGYAMYGGESREQFKERVARALDKIAAEECEIVAVFAHGGVLRTALDVVVGMKLPREKVMCSNCTVEILQYSDGIWSLHSWINLI